MVLSNCLRCKFYSKPQHYGDVGCSVNPYYYWLWWATSSNLELKISQNLPVDCCSDFDLHPDFVPISIDISLTHKQWQEIAIRCRNPEFLAQIQEVVIVKQKDWIQVDSSAINAVCFDSENNMLKIQFTSGSIYQYSDVAQDIFDSFLSADSKGSYFHQKIKHHYAYQQIS